MTNNPNVYIDLLIYSLLSGVLLRASYDLLTAVVQVLMLPAQRIGNGVGIGSRKYASTTAAPVPMQNTTTLSSAVKALSPKVKKSQIAVTAVIDILFSLIGALTVTLLLFGLNFGEIRWFVLPIIAVGYWAYGATVGRPVNALLHAVMITVRRFVWLIAHAIGVPTRKIVIAVKSGANRVRKSVLHKRTIGNEPTKATKTAEQKVRKRKNKKFEKK